MKILVGCEFSGIVRDSFNAMGHDAVSCDIIPSERPGNHIIGDVMEEIESDTYDMLIAFPPCTYLANSGVRWLFTKSGAPEIKRFMLMQKSAMFFNSLLECNIPKIAIENPIQHCYAREIIRKYDQIIHPWQYGHGESKATCLWLKNLPELIPTNIVPGRKPRVHYESPSENRQKNRSRTYTGIAEAMAEQWGV